MNDLEAAFDDSVFYDALGTDAFIQGKVVRVLWMGQSIDPSESAFDYGMTGSALKIEVQDQDKHLFTKGETVQVKGMTFSVFRAPVRNLSHFGWEVELES